MRNTPLRVRPGDHEGARVEDPGVPEVGDQQAALDVGHHLVGVVRAGAQQQVAWPTQPSDSPPSTPCPVETPPPALAVRRSSVSADRDPVAHQVEPSLGRALLVERQGDGTGVGGVVPDLQVPVELLLPQARRTTGPRGPRVR